jgi:hypothetical protein
MKCDERQSPTASAAPEHLRGPPETQVAQPIEISVDEGPLVSCTDAAIPAKSVIERFAHGQQEAFGGRSLVAASHRNVPPSPARAFSVFHWVALREVLSASLASGSGRLTALETGAGSVVKERIASSAHCTRARSTTTLGGTT